MSPDDALNDLIEALGATEREVVVGQDTLQHWSHDTREILSQSGLLTPTKQAESIECQQCDELCYLDVHIITHPTKPARAFIMCDDQDKQSHIEIPLAHLQQWKTSPLHFARTVAPLLNIECKAEYKPGQSNVRIGMIASKKGRRWLSLNISPPALEINKCIIPLDEALFFEEDKLSIDTHRIMLLAKDNRQGSSKSYTHSVEGREAGKRKTEAMYEDWKTEYIKLSRKHPDKSDVWFSKQIEKLPIGQSRNWETIREKMKPK